MPVVVFLFHGFIRLLIAEGIYYELAMVEQFHLIWQAYNGRYILNACYVRIVLLNRASVVLDRALTAPRSRHDRATIVP